MNFDIEDVTEKEVKTKVPEELPELRGMTLVECAETLSRENLPVNPFDIAAVRAHFAEYLKKVNEMFAQVEALVIDSDEANAKAVELGTAAMTLFRKIEQARDTHPRYVEAKEYVDRVDNIVKAITERLHSTSKKKDDSGKLVSTRTIVYIAKEKIAQYTAFQEQKRLEAEDLARKETEKLQQTLNKQAETIGVTAPTVATPVFPRGPHTTRTDMGSASVGKSWTYEIVESHYVRQLIADLKIGWGKFQMGEIPAEEITKAIDMIGKISPYLVISDFEVKAAIKGGIQDIPGIRIYQKSDAGNVRFNTRR